MQANPVRGVDLGNCDNEPIHLLGAIQPFGFLVAASPADWTITRVSRNAGERFGTGPSRMIGRPLEEFFTPDAVATIRAQFSRAMQDDTVARCFGVALTAGGLRCDLAVHASGGTAVIEAEACIEEDAVEAGAAVRAMLVRLQQAPDLRSFHRIAAREMRALTGFDRVMIYRFDHDGSGEVVAEAAREGLETYLGLHYPASDIPRQARRLYLRNLMRIIPDVGGAPSPIEPELGADGQPLDLSQSVLRSVSPIHIEYLRNMGVAASMSVSIVREGRLWGLIACHHYAPLKIGFARRTAAELFGQFLSLLLENREREDEAAYEAAAQSRHHRIITAMASHESRFDAIGRHLDELADLLPCDGVGLWIQGKATLKGLAPNAAQFAALVRHLDAMGHDNVHASHDIGAEVPRGRDFVDRAAGMLVVPLSRPPRDYLVFFRRENLRSVNWAGDPAKPITVGPLGDRLTPRKSFELWRETVRGQSLPWLPVERRVAESLRVSLLEVILRMSDESEAERRRAQQRQDLLIAELNHRVRNILGLVRGIVTQSRESAATLEEFTRVIGGRIHALARAHEQITADNWGPASFRRLVSAEAGAYLGEKAERVSITGTDFLLTPDAFTTVALVIHEMITNSAKYGALSDRRGHVGIAVETGAHGERILRWTERDGPPVKAPVRRGFGSTVIERSIPHDLMGEAELEYALAGLRARFVIPARHVVAGSEPANPAGDPPPREADPDMPRDVLLVEDSIIIALDTEETLKQLGVERVRTAGRAARALELIAQAAPDFALLDVNLGAESSFEVAQKLRALGVPFAFATGYGEQSGLPPEFAGVPILAKPYSAETIGALLRSAFRRDGGG